MSHKKTGAGRNRQSRYATPVNGARIKKVPAKGRPVWQKALRLAFYIIMSAFILVAIVHYAKRYIHLVSQH